jgi:hypothetical protein
LTDIVTYLCNRLDDCDVESQELLDSERKEVLGILGDYLEEQGREEMALACRWLRKDTRRFPCILTFFNQAKHPIKEQTERHLPEYLFNALEGFKSHNSSYWKDYENTEQMLISLGNALKKCEVAVD